MFDGIIEWACKAVIGITSGIFGLVSYTYQIFANLAGATIFSGDEFSDITIKIYSLFGVIVLFAIAYNILTFVVDPDKGKSESSLDLFKGIVTTIIIIVICPTIFYYSEVIQKAVVEGGVIQNIFSGSSSLDESSNSLIKGGRSMALATWKAFFHVVSEEDESQIKNASTLTSNIPGFTVCDFTNTEQCSLNDAANSVIDSKAGTFRGYKAFAKNWMNGDIDFDWFIAIFAGVYLAYVIISFCFDLAVRIFKLIFYELLSPLCIACRVIPNKKDIFKKWMSATIKTYTSLFVRLFVMNMGIYVLGLITSGKVNLACKDCDLSVSLLSNAFLILGLITFIKQVPKLVDETFGLNANLSTDIKGKLKEGGAFTAASVGSAVGGTLVKKGVIAGKNIKKTFDDTKGATKKEKWANRSAAILRGVGGTLGGGLASTLTAYKQGQKAGSLEDALKAGTGATQEQLEKQAKRAAYRAATQGGEKPYVGVATTAVEHLKDTGKGVLKWAGFNNIASLEAQNKKVSDMASKISGVKDAAKELMLSDGTKQKSKKYGVTGSKTFKTTGTTSSGILGPNGRPIVTSVEKAIEWDTLTRYQMYQALQSARSANASSVSYDGAEFEINSFETQLNEYTEEFATAIANKAGVSDTKWDSEDYADIRGDLDSVRSKANEARVVLERNIADEVLAAANADAVAKNHEAVTLDTVKSGDLVFDKDSALDSYKGKSKSVIERNSRQILRAKQEEKDKSGK